MPVGEKRRASRPQLNVIYEDDDFIAIDKPAGLLSVESDKDTESAYAYVADYLQRKDKSVRPFILHRIDKETSGVLIFAKNIKLHSMLRLNWNDYIRSREYYAVTEGKFEKKEDTIVSYLRENKNNLMYSTHDPSGQKAITHYKVIKENGQYSLLAVKIDTGRKNQIRVQMESIGHPVVGDDKYGQPKDPLRRLGLHASALEFEHPKTKQIIRIVAPMPASFGNLF
jgi:23S rRNA pseudouridine1911/1915/1917 synthase